MAWMDGTWSQEGPLAAMTPGFNPYAPHPMSGVGQQGMPGGNNPLTGQGNLPAMIANNPEAYVRLLMTRQYDPLETANALYPLRPGALGSSNGMVVIEKPEKRKAALAAVVADYANRRQMEQLLAAIRGRPAQPSALGQMVGMLGNAVGGGEPMAQPNAGQWERIFGGTGVTPGQWGQANQGPGFWGTVGGLLGRLGGSL